MAINTLNDAFIEELKDIYSSEKQIYKALPRMAKSATHPKLRGGFELHKMQTEVHVARLEAVAKMLGIKLAGKVCKATAGLVAEGNDVASEKGDNVAALDSMLLGSARRVEHYEIAAYTSAIAMADMLQLPKVAKLLSLTLAEEIQTDTNLNLLAVQELLSQALSQDSK